MKVTSKGRRVGGWGYGVYDLLRRDVEVIS